MYNKQWSEFEVQALAYSILRKNLYPNYLVRGEYKFQTCRFDIAIFKAHKNSDPELKVVLEVKKNSKSKTTSQGERYTSVAGVPCIYIRGGEDAYNVLKLVHDYL